MKRLLRPLAAVACALPTCALGAELLPVSTRALYAGVIALAYLGFCGNVIHRERRKRRRAHSAGTGTGTNDRRTATLVAFASQTGFAEQLAQRTCDALRAAGVAVRLRTLAQLDAATLRESKRALFIVSTTGEGDAPDHAASFARKVMREDLALGNLQYGVLALGDRGYDRFCAFGMALAQWLRQRGAQPLFDTIEVDNGDEGALRHWQHCLGAISARTAGAADWSVPRYQRWRLRARHCLNPGSPGAPTFHVVLEPAGATVDWQAGDIAEIGPCNALAVVQRALEILQRDGTECVEFMASAERTDRTDRDNERQTLAQWLARRRLPESDAALAALRTTPMKQLAEALTPLPHRAYSIASLPQDGCIELVVRQTQQDDGRLGLGSGWLTQHASPGDAIALRVRRNSGFHPPADDRPLILIGNGTGIAGLRAHLKARAATGRRRTWLLFGERSAAHDYYFREEIEAMHAAGTLARIDLAFSRDRQKHTYVQHCLLAAAHDLRAWVAQGAAIYVCGSRDGMAGGVDAVLKQALGTETVERLTESGHYRRDVY